MSPMFMIIRNDGKTDNIYECDFKEGTFLGGVQTYSYDDIRSFAIPKEFLMTLAGYKKSRHVVEDKKSEDKNFDDKKEKVEKENG